MTQLNIQKNMADINNIADKADFSIVFKDYKGEYEVRHIIIVKDTLTAYDNNGFPVAIQTNAHRAFGIAALVNGLKLETKLKYQTQASK